MAIKTIKQQTGANGFVYRLQQRGRAFDVVYCTGFCWKYAVKAVSLESAESTFFLRTI